MTRCQRQQQSWRIIVGTHAESEICDKRTKWVPNPKLPVDARVFGKPVDDFTALCCAVLCALVWTTNPCRNNYPTLTPPRGCGWRLAVFALTRQRTAAYSSEGSFRITDMMCVWTCNGERRMGGMAGV